MVYSVYVDNRLLFSTDTLSAASYVVEAKLSMSDNAAGSLDLTLLPGCPINVQRMKSHILVKRDGEDLWEGRALSEDVDFYNRHSYHFEGELAYLLDSIQPKRTFFGTVRAFLEELIEVHNSRVDSTKQFVVGSVTAHGDEEAFSVEIEYESTLDLITSVLVDSDVTSRQGHLRVRRVNGVRHLDYLSDYPTTNAQTIQFAENLLDFTQNFELTDLATVIIPVGELSDETDSGSDSNKERDDNDVIMVLTVAPDFDNSRVTFINGFPYTSSDMYDKSESQVSFYYDVQTDCQISGNSNLSDALTARPKIKVVFPKDLTLRPLPNMAYSYLAVELKYLDPDYTVQAGTAAFVKTIVLDNGMGLFLNSPFYGQTKDNSVIYVHQVYATSDPYTRYISTGSDSSVGSGPYTITNFFFNQLNFFTTNSSQAGYVYINPSPDIIPDAPLGYPTLRMWSTTNTMLLSSNSDLYDVETSEDTDTEDSSQITIESVNNGSIYLENMSLIDLYGRVEKVIDFGNVKSAADLLEKAKEWFSNQQFDDVTLEVSVLDLHYLNPDVTAFNLLDRVRCISNPHGMDRFFPVTSMDINLLQADDTIITLNQFEKQDISSTSARTNDIVDARLKTLPSQTKILDMAKRNATEIMNMLTNGYVTIVTQGKGDNEHAAEIIISETPDWHDSERLWKWSMNGFAYSKDGGLTWGLAITMDGAIVADFITSGVMSADRIQGGSLKLGGLGNYNGILEVYDEQNTLVGRWDVNGIYMLSGSKREVAIEIDNGRFKTYRNGRETGYINGNQMIEYDDSFGYGLRIAGLFGMIFRSPLIGVSQEFLLDDVGGYYDACGTGLQNIVEDVKLVDGALEVTRKTLRFTNGFMTTAIDPISTPIYIIDDSYLSDAIVHYFQGNSVERLDFEQIVQFYKYGSSSITNLRIPITFQRTLVYVGKYKDVWYVSEPFGMDSNSYEGNNPTVEPWQLENSTYILPRSTESASQQYRYLEICSPDLWASYGSAGDVNYIPRDDWWSIVVREGSYPLLNEANKNSYAAIQFYMTDSSGAMDGLMEKEANGVLRMLKGVSLSAYDDGRDMLDTYDRSAVTTRPIYYTNHSVRWGTRFSAKYSENELDTKVRKTSILAVNEQHYGQGWSCTPQLPFANWSTGVLFSDRYLSDYYPGWATDDHMIGQAEKLNNTVSLASPENIPIYRAKHRLEKPALVEFNSASSARAFFDEMIGG